MLFLYTFGSISIELREVDVFHQHYDFVKGMKQNGKKQQQQQQQQQTEFNQRYRTEREATKLTVLNLSYLLLLEENTS